MTERREFEIQIFVCMEKCIMQLMLGYVISIVVVHSLKVGNGPWSFQLNGFCLELLSNDFTVSSTFSCFEKLITCESFQILVHSFSS